MKNYKYDYNIYKENSPQEFKNACKKIEDFFSSAEKRNLLVDVDGSTIQVFTDNDKEVIVYDDYDVGAVYVLSDIDLDEIFN